MFVQIDSREKDRVKSASEYFKSQGLEIEVCELEVGDYLFDGKVVFEMKLISDFISSIQSGRIFNQTVDMMEHYNHRFIMIHGDLHTRSKCLAMTKHYQRVTVQQYINTICSLNRHLTVLQCYSPFINESYYTMMKQAEKTLNNKPIIKKFPRKDKNPCFNFLCYAIYGINYKKAKAIIDTYDLKNLSDLQNLTIEKLVKVDGIGEKNAIKIMEAIK